MGNGGGERWQWHCESAATHRQWFQTSSGFLICPTEVPAGGPESFLVQKSERLKIMKVTAIGVCSWFQGAKQATKLEERGSSKAFQLLTSFSRKTGDSKNSLSAEKNDFYIDVSNFGCPQASSIIMTRKGKRIKSWQSKEHHPWFLNDGLWPWQQERGSPESSTVMMLSITRRPEPASPLPTALELNSELTQSVFFKKPGEHTGSDAMAAWHMFPSASHSTLCSAF